MNHPNPIWDQDACVWRVDFRTPWRLGRRSVAAPPPPEGLIIAIHAARDLLEALRAAGERSSPQLNLPCTSDRTVAQVVKDFLREKRWKSAGGKRWGEETCALLKRELGTHPLTSIDVARLWAYRDEIRARGVGPKAMESRLIMLGQVLRWAAEPPRMWLPFVPPMPSPKIDETEVIRNALTRWIDESSFRVARACIYAHQTARNGLATELRESGVEPTAANVRAWIEQRKLYLSFAFYTGMRKHDLNEIDDSYLSSDLGCYFRHGRKTGVEVAAESICPPFASDILADLSRLGRPYRAGELIAGGAWKNSARVLETACRNAGVEKFTLMDCRRSFVYHKALAGVPLEKLVNLMGHRDSRMIREVYLQLQPRLQRDEAGAAWPKPLSALPGTGTARVLSFPVK